ncbi:EcsC family protein [Alkalibacillus haloalkaliphilus]|uniref:EcsC family protein n=1 Tax=Alkalibacillus haloalkaliphilus TaxID=94136 RepID=UPI002936CB46|nr:EcsC family protein [Alkalibacillus haloalkaliphilus]MDV2581223.1 EcsC family protein [Alkalibacillus haloalkaliphilus]
MGEERVLKEIERWEREVSSYVSNDFEKVYELWVQDQFNKLPKPVQRKFFESIDQWLLYTYTFLQGTNAQTEAYNRILQVGRTYDEDIQQIEDLRKLSIEKLTYLSDQQVARNRVYSFVQGGATGAGGWLLLGVDLPMMIGLNLRTVQLVGTSYGYNMHNPIEMVVALKVLHAGALPKRLQYEAWEELKGDIEQYDRLMSQEKQLTNTSWIEQPLRNVFKTIAILMFRKKLFQGVPLISVGIGATVNYKTAKNVSDFAKRFYQYRAIQERHH